MSNTFKITISISVLSLLIIIKPVDSQNEIPADFCISQEEYKLYNLINEYRKALNLPQIPLSRSLCFVAKQHITDLIQNKPDTNTCNFHSWSDKGNWKACCYEKKIKDKSCMQDKPKEITNYPGTAFEIVYWENKEANANNAFDQWRETTAARSVITNFKEWETYSWNALGIGIKKGFAIAWFGEELDVEKVTKICGTQTEIINEPPVKDDEPKVISTSSGRYYIIFGSFNSLNDARKEVVKYSENGFNKAKIISKDNKFRISLSDYSTKESASKAKKELPAKYKDAWIMPF